MTRNPEMVTNAEQLRERFMARIALYTGYMSAAVKFHELSDIEKNKAYAKSVYNAKREILIAVIACYGDATNMTFEQARIALGVSQTMLDTLP